MTDAVFDPKSLSRAAGAVPPGDDELRTGASVEPAGEQYHSCAPLKLAGDLTIAAVTAQHATLAGFISQGSDVTLDLSGVHECDTAGLQLLYSLRTTVLQRKERLQIVAVSPELQELAAALGLQIQKLGDTSGAGAADADFPSRSTTGGL